MVAFETIIVTEDVAVFPLASVAIAEIVCVPLVVVLVLKETEYGAEVTAVPTL